MCATFFFENGIYGLVNSGNSEIFLMNHTPAFNLSQWDPTDRIRMEDFNSDNAIIDAALSTRPQLIELLNVNETLTNVTKWRVEFPFRPEDYLALFFVYKLANTINFSIHDGGGSMYVLHSPAAALACFPMKNPDMDATIVPLASVNGQMQRSSYQVKNLTGLTVFYANGSTLSGDFGLRIYGLK